MPRLHVYLLGATFVWIICTIMISRSCSSYENEDLTARSHLSVPRDGPKRAHPLTSTFLLVLIMSSPNETARRQVIRDTWLKLSRKGPSVFIPLFPIGTNSTDTQTRRNLEAEQKEHADLALIEGLSESYGNLAQKTLKSLVFAFENYKFQFLLKVDSDSFVRLGVFINALLEVQHPRLYWGFLDGRAKPIRKGKWKETDWVLCDRYLPYQLGGGYVLSYELVKYLAVNSPLFKMYKNEDVSVGAWLAGLDIKYVHDPRFDTEWISRGCNNQYLITHKKSVEEMQRLFKNLVDSKKLCDNEFRTRPSYVYDWSAVPSKCCERINSSSIP